MIVICDFNLKIISIVSCVDVKHILCAFRCTLLINAIIDSEDLQKVPTKAGYFSASGYLWPLLLTWFNFNPSVDK